MSNAEQTVKKIRLKVECPLIEETSLEFPASDNFLEHGAYGKVCRAKFEGKDVAVKYFKSAEEKRGYKQELVFLKCLQSHDNIVILFGTGVSKKTKEPYIVMEFASYSLERVLHGGYPKYEYGADHVMHWSRQTAVGLNYIHNKRILHRDIKASNLLLFGDGSHLKLCDFGTCRNLETNLLYTANIGTVRYMAPEVIQGDPYTTMCDVFSFAITMWEMLARKVPTIDLGTSNLNSFAILYQMAQGKRPPLLANVPRFVNELLVKCWHQDPGYRLSSSDVANKLINVCKYFPFGRPLSYEDSGEQEEETEDEEEIEEENATLSPQPSQPNTSADKNGQIFLRTQSDVSFIKSDSSEAPTESDPLAQSYTSIREARSKSIKTPGNTEGRFHHGYPPRDSYVSPRKEPERVLSGSDIREGHIVVDHEVNEVLDPHTETTKYASLDENRLRFDVQCQYQQIEQTYQPSSLPSTYHSRLPAAKEQLRTRYLVPGSRIQPVPPDENDPESIRMWEQFKKLTEQLANT